MGHKLFCCGKYRAAKEFYRLENYGGFHFVFLYTRTCKHCKSLLLGTEKNWIGPNREDLWHSFTQIYRKFNKQTYHELVNLIQSGVARQIDRPGQTSKRPTRGQVVAGDFTMKAKNPWYVLMLERVVKRFEGKPVALESQ